MGPPKTAQTLGLLLSATLVACVEPEVWSVPQLSPGDPMAILQLDTRGRLVQSTEFVPFEGPLPVAHSSDGRLWVVGYRRAEASGSLPRPGERPRLARPTEVPLSNPDHSFWVENGRLRRTLDDEALPLTVDRVASDCPAVDRRSIWWLARCGFADFVGRSEPTEDPCGVTADLLPRGANVGSPLADPSTLPVSGLQVQGYVDGNGIARLGASSEPTACTVVAARSAEPRVIQLQSPDPVRIAPHQNCPFEFSSRYYAGLFVDVLPVGNDVYGILTTRDFDDDIKACRDERPVRPGCLVRASLRTREVEVQRCGERFDQLVRIPGRNDVVGVLEVEYEGPNPQDLDQVRRFEWSLAVHDRSDLEPVERLDLPGGSRGWVRSKSQPSDHRGIHVVFRSSQSRSDLLEIRTGPLAYRVRQVRNLGAISDVPSQSFMDTDAVVVTSAWSDAVWDKCSVDEEFSDIDVGCRELAVFSPPLGLNPGSQYLSILPLDKVNPLRNEFLVGLEGVLLRGSMSAQPRALYFQANSAAVTDLIQVPALADQELSVVAMAWVVQTPTPLRNSSAVLFWRRDDSFAPIVLPAGEGWIAELHWTDQGLVARDALTERILFWPAEELALLFSEE